MSSLKKLWTEHGVLTIIVLIAVAYAINMFASYLTSKGRPGSEKMTAGVNTAYVNNMSSQGGAVQPSQPLGQNEVFASAKGIQTSNPGVPASCSTANIQNPAELLPKSANNEWATLNPSGKGELSNINLLKAGYHIGIDTIGQTLRNANLQIRSEPPNPQLYVGPWNTSTIEPDFMRPPLNIGAGTQ